MRWQWKVMRIFSGRFDRALGGGKAEYLVRVRRWNPSPLEGSNG